MRGGKIGVGRLERGSCKKWERVLKERRGYEVGRNDTEEEDWRRLEERWEGEIVKKKKNRKNRKEDEVLKSEK